MLIRPVIFADLALLSSKDPQAKLNAKGEVDADWFCLCTACKVNQLIYILDFYRAQIPFPEQVKAIKREHKFWHAGMIGIESAGYQWVMGQQLWEQSLPAIPISAPGDIVYRAQLVTPHVETGRVRLRGVKENGVLVPHPSMKRLLIECGDFPFGDHDDVLSAFCGAVTMLTNEEIMGQQPVVTRGASVFSSIGVNGRRRSTNNFDVFPSRY